MVVVVVRLLVYAATPCWHVLLNGADAVFVQHHQMLDSRAPIVTGAAISTYPALSRPAPYLGSSYYEGLSARAESADEDAALPAQSALPVHHTARDLDAVPRPRQRPRKPRSHAAVGVPGHTLDPGPKEKIPLEQQLEARDLRLGIEKPRFGRRLRLQFDVDPAALGALLPSLLLPPLVENALKCAIAPFATAVRCTSAHV